MADGITLATGNNTSPPNATKFATDEGSGGIGHIPLVALVYSDSTGTLIPAGANGLSVSVSAGTVVLGGLSSGTATATAIAYSTASGTVLASSTTRVGFNIINVSTAIASVHFGATANGTAALIERLEQWERLSDAQTGLYYGPITIIGSAAGTAVVTEW